MVIAGTICENLVDYNEVFNYVKGKFLITIKSSR